MKRAGLISLLLLMPLAGYCQAWPFPFGYFQPAAAAPAGVTTQQYASTVGIWMPIDMTSNVDPLADYSAVGTNTAAHVGDPTYITNSGTIAGNYDLDGVGDYFKTGSGTDFNFGDAATDSPFSGYVWFNPDSLSINQEVLTKYVTGLAQYEWKLFWAQSVQEWVIRTYDNSSAVYKGRSGASGAAVGVWEMVAFTYDGTALDSGFDLYSNGSVIDDTDRGVGGYVAMHNTGSDIRLGTDGTTDANGKISHAFVWSTNLTASEISAEFQRTAQYFGWLDGIDVNIASGDEFLTNGLVRASSFEYDTAADQGPNGYHATVSGPTHTVDGSGGFSFYSFDNINDNINLGDVSAFTFTSQLTFSAWIRLDSTAASETIMSKWSGTTREYIWNVEAGGALRLYLTDETNNGSVWNISTTTLSTGQWYHVAAVVSDVTGANAGTNITHYINGAADTGTANSSGTYSTMVDQAQNLFIGSVAGGSFFGGDIDDVRLYNLAWGSGDPLTYYQTSTNQVAR